MWTVLHYGVRCGSCDVWLPAGLEVWHHREHPHLRRCLFCAPEPVDGAAIAAAWHALEAPPPARLTARWERLVDNKLRLVKGGR